MKEPANKVVGIYRRLEMPMATYFANVKGFVGEILELLQDLVHMYHDEHY